MDLTRRGPQVEIKRGSWEERLREIDAGARAELARPPAPVPGEGKPLPVPLQRLSPPPLPPQPLAGASPASFRWALLQEPGEAAGKLCATLKPLLGEDVLVLLGKESPLRVGGYVPRLLEAHAQEPLVGVAVVGAADRADAREAGWKLGALAARPWVFLHAEPESNLPPTIGEKVAKFMDVIAGIAFMEGPKPSRR